MYRLKRKNMHILVVYFGGIYAIMLLGIKLDIFNR